MIPLFLVPARGGSRRLPNKNTELMGGIPLIGHAIRRARTAARILGIERPLVVCSTDDEVIARVARDWGGAVPFMRPPTLATDDSSSFDVAIHALEALEAEGMTLDLLILVQPTSPLQTADDIVRTVRTQQSAGDSAATVTLLHHAGVAFRLADDVLLTSGEPGQALGEAVVLNGGCYAITPSELRETSTFVTAGRTRGVVTEPSHSIDIDEPSDLQLARAMMESRPTRVVSIGDRPLDGQRCFVIAEVGVNHNGDLRIAQELVTAAAAAGADAVKFQSFSPTAIASSSAPLADYQRDAGETGDQRSMLERLALTPKDHATIQQLATSLGILFFSTPFDAAAARMLDELDVPAFKVGSGELTNIPLLEEIAAYGRPMLISTGMATMREVAGAVDAVEATGVRDIALLHCVSNYPADPGDSNLKAMAAMRAAFGYPTGWSDHMADWATAVAAVAMGASLLEKHITLDRRMPGPDHAASIEPDDFAAMVRAIRAVERARGSGVKVPVAAEISTAAVARRSLHWAASLGKGTVVHPEHLVALRPGTGLQPSLANQLGGLLLGRDVTEGAMVVPADLGLRADENVHS